MDERPPPLLHPSVRPLAVPQPVPAAPAEETGHLEAQVARLERALATRSQVDQARGILMHRFALDAPAALELMTLWAAVTGLALADLATALVQLTGGGEAATKLPGKVARQVLRLMREGPRDPDTPSPGLRSITPP